MKDELMKLLQIIVQTLHNSKGDNGFHDRNRNKILDKIEHMIDIEDAKAAAKQANQAKAAEEVKAV